MVKKGSRSTPHARRQNNRHTKSFGGGSFKDEEGDDDNDDEEEGEEEQEEEQEEGLERVSKLVYIILPLFTMFVLLCMWLFLPIRHRAATKQVRIYYFNPGLAFRANIDLVVFLPFSMIFDFDDPCLVLNWVGRRFE